MYQSRIRKTRFCMQGTWCIVVHSKFPRCEFFNEKVRRLKFLLIVPWLETLSLLFSNWQTFQAHLINCLSEKYINNCQIYVKN